MGNQIRKIRGPPLKNRIPRCGFFIVKNHPLRLGEEQQLLPWFAFRICPDGFDGFFRDPMVGFLFFFGGVPFRKNQGGICVIWLPDPQKVSVLMDFPPSITKKLLAFHIFRPQKESSGRKNPWHFSKTLDIFRWSKLPKEPNLTFAAPPCGVGPRLDLRKHVALRVSALFFVSMVF